MKIAPMMTPRIAYRPLTLALLLGVAQPALAMTPAPATQTPVRESLQDVLTAPRFDPEAAERLYNNAVLSGRVDDLVRRLQNAAQGTDEPPAMQGRALLLKASVDWLRGDLEAAQASVDGAQTLAPDADVWRLKAQIMDARGDDEGAAAWYEKAAQATVDPAAAAALRLRVAVIRSMRKPDALAAYARAGSPALRRRVAVTLAVLGDFRDALDLYGPAEAPEAYRDEIRMADWAIATGQAGAARDHAWQAFTLTSGVEDRRYALALLVESFRNAKDLPGALAFLEGKPASPDVVQVRVDLLLEMQRYDAAIALVSQSTDPDLRARLLGILDMGGRGAEGEGEYRRLIAADPHRLEGYTALATLHLARDDRAGALAVYRDFFAHNAGRAQDLVQAARQMIATGLGDDAMAMMESAAQAPGMAVPYRFFLIETGRAQGKDAEVQANLEMLRKTLPAASPQRVTLADIDEAMGRKDQALSVLRDLEKADPALDYDQKVHIATLAGDAGQLDEALDRWRTLWRQAALPARKIYLAKQVVRVARQGNRLDALAGEFEQTLASGKAGQDVLGLLIELRIAQNNREDAVRDVERFAAGKGLDDAAKLKQLVAVYLRLKAYDDVEATLHRLVTADPKNADIYLRQLTLNAVRFPREGETGDKRAARVSALLDALNKASGFDRPQALQFAAAIYAEAGFTARATDAYRRAQAMQPGNLDTLGQMTDLMRKQGQQMQAAALLQYRALHAATPGDLVATINALMAAMSGGSADGKPIPGLAQMRQANLAWARRLVIERMAGSGEDARLYAVLADLGQAQGDFALQMRAYGTSLAIAGDQRPAVLRFLITLASGASSGEGAGPALGDVSAKLAYGRRLIALRREYPPEVYTDLARSLLAVGDMPGAESAFAMMGDISGLVNVDQLKGETYAGQGFAPQALINYDRALLHDQGNVDLVVKTSVLREQLGQDRVASLWYWRSLLGLLRQQPDRRPDVDTDTAVDVRQYVPTLTEGLLLTWPEDHVEASARMEQLRQMVDQSLAGIPVKDGLRLTDFPRLALVVDLARRIAARTGDRVFMAGVDQALDTRFAGDIQARDEASLLRHAMGWAQPAGGIAEGLRQQAEDEGNVELIQSLAFAGEDDAPLRAAMERAMVAYGAYDAALRGGDLRPSGGEELLALILKASDHLTPDRFRRLILQPLDAAPFRDDLFFDIYRSAGAAYARLVTLAGHPLLGDDRLLDLLVARGGLPPLFTRATFANRHDASSSPANLIARFSIDQKLTLYERLVDHMVQTGQDIGFQAPLVVQLMQADLNGPQRARFAKSLSRDVTYDHGQEEKTQTAGHGVERLLLLTVKPANRPVLMEAARAVADRYADGRHLPEFLDAWYAGDKALAYRRLGELYADTSAHYQGGDYARPIIRRELAEQQRQEVETFLAQAHADKREIAAFYRTYVLEMESSGSAQDRAQIPHYYEKLVALDPDNATFAAGLLGVQWAHGDRDGFVALLQAYVTRHPQEREAASVLEMALNLTGHADAIAVVVARSGIDLSDPDTLIEMLNRASAPAEGSNEPNFHRLFTQLYDPYKAANVQAPAIVEVARRADLARRQQAAAGSRQDGFQPLLAAMDKAPPGKSEAALRDALRALWRGNAPSGQDGQGTGGLDRLGSAMALPDPDGDLSASAARLRDALEQPVMTHEMDGWLQALPPTLRARQTRLYALVAAGSMRQGLGGERIAAGLAALSAGTISAHEMQLLATLLDRTHTSLTLPQLHDLAAQFARQSVQTVPLRILYARLFAHGGDVDSAGALLDAALMEMIYPSAGDVVDVAALQTAMVTDLRGWTDKAAAHRVYASLSARIVSELGAAAKVAPFDRWPALGED